MLLRMIRWWFGYVCFTIAGAAPERFLTLAAREGYVLWDIAKTGGVHQAKISCRQYRSLRPSVRKARVRLRVQKRRGFPFVWRVCRDKRGLLYGAVGGVVILLLLSMRVWCIDVEGNELLSADEIKQAAAECGLYAGMKKSDLEPRVVQQRLMARFPQIGWVAVNTWGNTAKIRLQEGIEIPEVENTEHPVNVLAAKSGQIIAMDVYHGTPLVQVGDAVAEGDLLVSGVLTGLEGQESFVHSSARVIAQTRRVFAMEVPLRQTSQRPNGTQVTRRSLSIFGAGIPLSFQGQPRGDYTRTLTAKPLVINGAELPVTLYEETFTMQETFTVERTPEQAREKALEEITKKQKEVLQDGRVVSASEQETVTDGVYRLEMECVCEENIAQERDILVDADQVL